MYNKFLLG